MQKFAKMNGKVVKKKGSAGPATKKLNQTNRSNWTHSNSNATAWEAIGARVVHVKTFAKNKVELAEIEIVDTARSLISSPSSVVANQPKEPASPAFKKHVAKMLQTVTAPNQLTNSPTHQLTKNLWQQVRPAPQLTAAHLHASECKIV